MADRDNEIVGLMVAQSEDEAKDKPEAAKRGGRYVQSAFPGAARSKVRFGAKPSGLHDDRFVSNKPAPGPKGPEIEKLLDWAKERRRARAEAERSGR